MWVRAARQLGDVFVGKGMDEQRRKAVHKRIERDIKKFGRSRLLMPFDEAVAYLKSEFEAALHRPYRRLPKITDPETGERRHMTPAEARAAAAESGYEPIVWDSEMLAEAFQPRDPRPRKPARGRVRFNDGSYYASKLVGRTLPVWVAYDRNDASRIWCYDERDELIAVAELDGYRSTYPETVDQREAARRKAAQIKRIDAKYNKLSPASPLIEATPVNPATDARVLELTADRSTRPEETREDRYRRLRRVEAAIERGERVDEGLCRWAAYYRTDSECRAIEREIKEWPWKEQEILHGADQAA